MVPQRPSANFFGTKMTIFDLELIFLFENVIFIWIWDLRKFRIDLETEHNHVVNIVVFGFNMI